MLHYLHDMVKSMWAHDHHTHMWTLLKVLLRNWMPLYAVVLQSPLSTGPNHNLS